MPPRCPGCGRFLSNALIEGLSEEPADCPHCGRRLIMADVTTEEDAVEEPEGARQEAADASGGKDDGTDEDTGGYPGGQVGDAADPLAGWDEHGGGVGSVGERPQPRWLPDGTVLALVGLIGAVLGAATTRRRRAGALLGGFAGLLLGMIERRLWEGR